MKKLLSALLVLCMVLTLLPATVRAATTVASGNCGAEGDGSNLTWSLDSDGVLTISGTGAMADYDPDNKNYAPWYSERASIRSISIGDGVTSIGNWAFGLYAETSGFTFYGITGNISVPSSVTSIGNYAFQYCKATGTLTIANGVATIGNYAFAGCKFTGSLTIPDSVTSIGHDAFEGCSGFTGNLTIPASVTSIGTEAFVYCSGLTSLSISKGVKLIVGWEFSGCSGLTGSLTIPDSVTSIGNSAFNSCSGFTGLLTIPKSVTSIGDWAFCSCSGFTGNLTIPNSVTSISKFAFNCCSGLTSVSMPNCITAIGDYAFSGCNNLRGTLNIPEAVTSIGQSAFGGCGYSKVVIPAKTDTIMREAFYECPNLSGAYFKGSAPTKFNGYGDGQYEEREIYGAFDGCASDFTVYYPASNNNWVIDNNGKWKGYAAKPWDGKTIIASNLSNGTLSLDYKLSDAAVTAATCTVVAAAYSGGRLVGIQTLTNQDTADLKTNGCTITVQVPSSLTNVTWKILLLDSNTACKPLTSAASGTISST